jgi:maleamate amidohydrolase
VLERLLNISQAAKLLGVSSSTLRRLEKNGVVEGYGLKVIYTPGGQRRYLLDEVQELYTKEGFSGQLGFGSRPALLIRDMVTAFTDPNSRLAIELANQIESCKELISTCQSRNIPVIFSRTIYDPDNESSVLWGRKFPSLCVLNDEKWTEIHAELASYSYSMVINNPYITDFFRTGVEQFFTQHGVDTLILAGATTSGSIRANAVDAIQRGLRVIIPKEAVGDRNQSLQATALVDLNARYGDVMDTSRVMQHLSYVNN